MPSFPFLGPHEKEAMAGGGEDVLAEAAAAT